MLDLNWSATEKKLSRQVFLGALAAELAQVMADFKARAAAVTVPDDMWELEDYIRDQRVEIDEKYDYRYSRLIFLFVRLLREGRIQEQQLAGLAPQKLDLIQQLLSFASSRADVATANAEKRDTRSADRSARGG